MQPPLCYRQRINGWTKVYVPLRLGQNLSVIQQFYPTEFSGAIPLQEAGRPCQALGPLHISLQWPLNYSTTSKY